MIKKCLLGLGITILGIIGFSNAGYSDIIVHHNGQLISQGQGGLKFQVSGRGALLSQYLGISRRILAFAGGDEKVYFWWGNSGVPYMYYYYPGDNVSMQGFFNAYQICDEINSGSTESTNCTTYHINTGTFYESLTPFFNSVKSTDYFGYSYGRYTIYTRVYYLRVCFSSSEYGQSVCFMSSDGLNSSLGLDWNLAFGDLPQSVIGNPPGYYEYVGENNTNNSITNIGSCPTIRQLMQNMGENYNTGLCYNNTMYFNGSGFEQVEKEDIFTIFNNDYQEYINRISIYRNNCNTPATPQNCQNVFSGEYKKYSIITNAINGEVDEKKLRNYCNLGLNYDTNATTCVASGGGIKEPYTNEEIIEEIVNEGVIPTPDQQNTGENQDNVLNALNKCENGDRECYVNDRNFIDSLSNIYGKITGLFKERNGVNGIIPNYILRITFLTILFTVIFKK